jgi:hypothetical protein
MDLLLVKGEPLVTGALGLSYDVSVSIRWATSSGDIANDKSPALARRSIIIKNPCGASDGISKPRFWARLNNSCYEEIITL